MENRQNVSGPGEPDVIIVQRKGPAAWLTLNRPKSYNALTPELMRRLADELERLRDDASVRVLVITGAGRAFCSGVDLSALGKNVSMAEATASFAAVAEPATDLLRSFPKPVIAAVNGAVFAGGLEILMLCDLVVSSRDAKFGDGHANFGLIPGGGSTARLPRRVGVALAKYMIFTGAQVDAATLREAGLINQVVAPEALEDAVNSLVAQLADKSPLALARCKRLIDTGLHVSEAEAMRTEAATALEHCNSFDAREGLAAFAAKRKPAFVGK
jgi:enoyl-CoA hydratase/carnithine racemase